MKKIFALLIATAPFITFAQSKTPTKVPIADETEVAETKTKYKVITSSEDVYQKLMKKFPEDLHSVSIRLHKVDRHGKYVEYTLYFLLEAKTQVEKFLKSL